jgi:hypothetical protein
MVLVNSHLYIGDVNANLLRVYRIRNGGFTTGTTVAGFGVSDIVTIPGYLVLSSKQLLSIENKDSPAFVKDLTKGNTGRYNFQSLTADPGTTNNQHVRANNVTLTSATTFHVGKMDLDSEQLSFLNFMITDIATNTPYELLVSKTSNTLALTASTSLTYNVTAISDTSGTYHLTVSNTAGTMTLTDSTTIYFTLTGPAYTGMVNTVGSNRIVQAAGFVYYIDTMATSVRRVDMRNPLGNLDVITSVSSTGGSYYTYLSVEGRYVMVSQTGAVVELNIFNQEDLSINQAIASIAQAPTNGMVLKGKYLYHVSTSDRFVRTYDVGGSLIPTLETFTLSTGDLYVSNDITMFGQFNTTGNVMIGNGLQVRREIESESLNAALITENNTAIRKINYATVQNNSTGQIMGSLGNYNQSMLNVVGPTTSSVVGGGSVINISGVFPNTHFLLKTVGTYKISFTSEFVWQVGGSPSTTALTVGLYNDDTGTALLFIRNIDAHTVADVIPINTFTFHTSVVANEKLSFWAKSVNTVNSVCHFKNTTMLVEPMF